jgi:phosphatidylglycerophosphate synthase
MDYYDDPDGIPVYHYRSVNKSILDRVYVHWWNIAIRAVPARMSANLLSMLGNVGSWAAMAILMLFGPSIGPSQPWLFALAGLLVFIYQTIDCVDGMQARRIGSSGPLGEFVDHWFDAFNVFFFPLGVIVAFPVVPAGWAVPAIVISGLADWIVLRELAETGEMRFGYISTDEAITIYILFLLSVPLLGYAFWSQPLPWLGLPPCFLLLALPILGNGFMCIHTLIKIRFAGTRNLLVQLASTIPLMVWVFVAEYRMQPRWMLILGLLTIGFVGARHVGDLLRVRLLGMRQPAWYPDLVSSSAAVLVVSMLHLVWPALPAWLFSAPLLMVLVLTAMSLIQQFRRTVQRVQACLGIGLFDVPEAPPHSTR